MRADYAARLARSRRRSDPSRVKRAPRGSYKAKMRETKSAGTANVSAEDAWGVLPVGSRARPKTSTRRGEGPESLRPPSWAKKTGGMCESTTDALAPTGSTGNARGSGSKRKSALKPSGSFRTMRPRERPSCLLEPEAIVATGQAG
ncbi:unnamed protein product [Symbiodinium sp. CCMP2592]|nr:unnamed protein product [Symbiodinium sp. CCMP2592]